MSAILRFSKTAVHQAFVKLKTDGTNSDRKRSGPPRKTTQRDDYSMRRMVVRSPMSSCKKIRAQMRLTGLKLSASTVPRRLIKEFGPTLFHRIPP